MRKDGKGDWVSRNLPLRGYTEIELTHEIKLLESQEEHPGSVTKSEDLQKERAWSVTINSVERASQA